MSTRWAPAPTPEEARQLEATGLPRWQADVLARRGVTTAEEAQAFLAPSLGQLHDPALLPDLEAAVARLIAARDAQETIAVVGDYDVDGVTASAQLLAVFQAAGISAQSILPDRQREGYGFQPLHAERAHRAGCTLVVTADCGSASIEAVERARELGIDVIVTDHHLTDGVLPEGTLEVNPNRSDSDYPFPQLCAAGIAFKLATAFFEAIGRRAPTGSLLRMAALGTIADLVPLVGENRVLAALGLRELPTTPSPGLRALMAGAGVGRRVTAEDVGYRIGPRLNAAGRMAAADSALELLMTRDSDRARAAAAQLEEWNRDRRDAQRKVTTEAIARWEEVTELPPILVAWDAEWHAGVVGISAGQVARHYHRPALLLQVDGDTARGSGRSLREIDLHAFLKRWDGELDRFGGHSQAVGLTVETGRLEGLTREWQETAEKEWPPEALERVLHYEAQFEPDALDRELLASLERLEPFGMGHRRPRLRTGVLELRQPPRCFGDGHASGVATTPGGGQLSWLGWGWEARLDDLERPFEALGYLEYDDYRGAPVFRLEDVRPVERDEPTANGDGA